MPTDYWLETRKAVVAHLIAGLPLGTINDAAKVWGEVPPANVAWPFIRIGFAVSGPFEAQGWDGSTHRMTVHTFAHGNDTGDISKINKAVIARMQTLVIPGLSIVDLQFVGSNTVRDTAEANAFHGINDFDITVA